MASIVIPFPGWGRSTPTPGPGRVRQRPLPFPRTPRLVAPSERVIPWASASLLFVTAVLNFYIFQVSIVATSSYELQRIERELESWRAKNEQLKLELARARSLNWVEFQAIDRLGMARGEAAFYIRVLPDSQSVVSLSEPQSSPSHEPPTEEEAPPGEVELAGAPHHESGQSILAWITSLFDR